MCNDNPAPTFELHMDTVVDLMIHKLKSMCKGATSTGTYNRQDPTRFEKFHGIMYLTEFFGEEEEIDEDDDEYYVGMQPIIKFDYDPKDYPGGPHQPLEIKISDVTWGIEIELRTAKDDMDDEWYPWESIYYSRACDKGEEPQWLRPTAGFQELMDKALNHGSKYKEWMPDMPYYV